MYAAHRHLHVRPHSFPTRRSSDLFSSLPKRSSSTLLRRDSSPRAVCCQRTWAAGEHTPAVLGDSPVAYEDSTQRPSTITHKPPKPNSSISTGVFLTTRSEEHTSELQSLMRISYAVFCLKKN